MQKITINSKELQKALNKVGGCINPKHTLPIIQNVYFKAAKGQITLTATNLEITATTELKNEGTVNLDTLIPYQYLKNILQGLPSAPLEMEFLEKQVHLVCGTSDFNVPLVDPEDWPTPEPTDYAQLAELQKDGFLEGLKNALLFTDKTDDFRGMCNVRLFTGEGLIKVAGVTGHFIYEKSIGPAKGDINLLLSGPAGQYLVTDPFNEETITLHSAGNMLRLSGTDTIIDLLQPDHKPPLHEPLFKSRKDVCKVLELNREELKKKLNRITGVVDMPYHSIRIDTVKENTTLTYNNVDYQFKGTEQMPSTLEGEPFTIGFNAAILQKLLSVCDEETVKLEVIDPMRTVFAFPQDARIIIMPHAI